MCDFGLVAALSDIAMFTQSTGLQALALVKPTLRGDEAAYMGRGVVRDEPAAHRALDALTRCLVKARGT